MKNFVIIGHHAGEVENFVKTNYENAKTVLQTPQLGTGHAVSMVCPMLKDYKGLVINTLRRYAFITEETLKDFIEFHKSQNSDLP